MKAPSSDQKLRGGYYTPHNIAVFLATWAVRSADDDILEPSCGDGEIVEALTDALRVRKAFPTQIANQIQGVEFDADEAEKARARLRRLSVPSRDTIHTGDFFTWCNTLGVKRFDAVVGNPPFIRYQNFPSEHRDAAFALMRSAGLKPNGLTNAWVPFVCLSTILLKNTGRLAMVIPSELLQVSYSAELRRFLSDSFQKVTLFTFKELLFKEAQQEVVLFCGERGGVAGRGIEVVELTNADELQNERPHRVPLNAYKPMDHSTEKWTQYFLAKREIALLREMRSNKAISCLGEVASVDVGIVTGLNEFFVLTEADRAHRRLTAYTEPIVTRSAQLRGLLFDDLNFRTEVEQNARVHLLRLPDCAFDKLSAAAKCYVLEGEKNGFNLGFKCRNRNPWWVVPSFWVPDGFMLRQIHRYPKIAVNESGATCTDTIHRVRMLNGNSITNLAAAFLNSLTFAFSEVLGRSYGGGVLELEPTEAERMPVPLLGADALDYAELSRLLVADRLDDALQHTDRVLLRDALGLSSSDVICLRGIWKKLMERRHGRKVSRRTIKDRQGVLAISAATKR
jgi:adenine-specific DNA-methyltransferase